MESGLALGLVIRLLRLSGRRGGLFVSRAAALKYAWFENGRRPHLIVTMPGTLELDMSTNAFPGATGRDIA